LRWTYTPPDYFEESVEVVGRDHRMTIGNGVAEARIHAATFDATPGLRKRVHDELSARFLATKLLKRRPYELSDATVHDGRGNVTLEIASCRHEQIVTSQGNLEVLAYDDATGKVIIDTKRDQAEKDKEFVELAVRHGGDTVVRAMLNSFDQADKDPADACTHLHEIRDALSKAFGGDDAAKAALGIHKTKWSRFGFITCVLPLNQGRHRGDFVGTLRDATQEELDEARGIAREMIEAYLRTLTL
jgi:hypothetical protein